MHAGMHMQVFGFELWSKVTENLFMQHDVPCSTFGPLPEEAWRGTLLVTQTSPSVDIPYVLCRLLVGLASAAEIRTEAAMS
jgi:hypothetical protein